MGYNVSLTGMIIMFSFIGVFAAGTFSLLLIHVFTPMGVFLRAWLKKQPVILNVGREQSGEFVLGKTVIGGLIKTKKKGVFFATKGSHLIERKSRVPLFLTHAEFAGTLPYDLLQKLDVLSRKAEKEGKPLDTFEDYQKYLEEQKLSYKDDNGAVVEVKDGGLKLFEHVSFSAHDIPKFKYNLDPTFQDRYTENEKLLLQRTFFNKLDPKVIVLGGFLLLAAGFGVLLAFKGFSMYSGPSCPSCECIVPTVRTVSQVVSQNISSLIG